MFPSIPPQSLVRSIDKEQSGPALQNGEPGNLPKFGEVAYPVSSQQGVFKQGALKRNHEKTGATPDSKKPKSDDDQTAAATSDNATVTVPSAVDKMKSLGAEPDVLSDLVTEIVDPNKIHPGTPRSGEPYSGNKEKIFSKHRFYDEKGKSDIGLQLFWQAKHTKFVKLGYTSLIGEVATYIDRYFKECSSICVYDKVYTGNSSSSIKKFKKSGDIQTYDGSYENIISLMKI